MAQYVKPAVPQVTDFSTLFTTPEKAEKFIPRLAISLDAQDKCGKTYYSLMTTPEPIAYVAINDSITTYQKAVAGGRDIHLLEIDYAIPNPAILKADDVDKEQHKSWILAWHRYKDAMKAVKANPKLRTLVLDTGTELWHLAELAHFGKLRGNIRMDIRTELNADYTGVFWDLYRSRPDLNIIIIHRTKKQYMTVLGDDGKPKKDKKGEDIREWNGKYERDGYNAIGFAVDMTVQAGWNGSKREFYTRIDAEQATRFGTNLTGVTWSGEDSGFANLALEVFPDTISTPEIWGL